MTEPYPPGQIVNGHVWTGSAWVPVQPDPAAATAPPLAASVQPGLGGNSTWPTQPARKSHTGKIVAIVVAVVVVGVLGVMVLAAIAIPVFLNQRTMAVQGELGTNLRNAAMAMETGYTDTGTYPTEDQLARYGFTPTAGVQVTVATDTGDTYCLEATKQDTAMHITSSSPVADGPCP